MSSWIRKIIECVSLVALYAGLMTHAYAQNMPPVVQAAKDGEWQMLSTLLTDGVSANSLYGDGSSALHWASYHESIDGAQALLDAKAEVNTTTDLGVTPLWLAAENANAAMTQLLLAAGADPNVALHSGETPLMTASQTGNADVVRLLLAAGADPNPSVTRDQTALMWAASQGHGAVVEVLLEYDADIHARSLVREQYIKSEKEQDSNTAYKYWIEQGGNTPLLFAARAGDLRSAQALVAAGSDVNELSAFGTSPAIMAVHGGNAELLAYLLDSGADIESATSGHTVLHAAVLRGNLAAINVLLERGANTEALLLQPTPARRQSSDYSFHNALLGSTPLWLAARFSEPRIMEALLAAGADPHAVNALSYPAQRLGEDFITDEGDISLVMAAAGMGYRRLRMSWGTPERRAGQVGRDREALILDTVSVAIEAGVDVNMQDADGQSALAFAKARRYESVVSLLETAGAR